MIGDDHLRPDIGPTTSHAVKLFRHAKFTGPSICPDWARVWGYLAQCLISTPGWSVVKIHQKTKNTRQAWFDLERFYAGPAERRKEMVVAHAALKVLIYKSEDTFTFAAYALQMMGHFETLERGGQPESEVQKVTRLIDQIENNNIQLQNALEMVSYGVNF